MNAVLHFPYWGAKPDGIWWFDGSATLGSYYPDNQPLSIVGGMSMWRFRYRADEVDVPEYFTRLAERTPRPDHWETIKLTGIDAKAFLDLARKVGTKAA
jgi:hypothetical protein